MNPSTRGKKPYRERRIKLTAVEKLGWVAAAVAVITIVLALLSW